VYFYIFMIIVGDVSAFFFFFFFFVMRWWRRFWGWPVQARPGQGEIPLTPSSSLLPHSTHLHTSLRSAFLFRLLPLVCPDSIRRTYIFVKFLFGAFIARRKISIYFLFGPYLASTWFTTSYFSLKVPG